MQVKLGRWMVASAAAALVCGQTSADPNMPVPEMSLEELVNTEVTSAARKAQSQQHVAAAVFVITRDDITRSGARTLADVLAMAPGIEVARLGNDRWAVTTRGFNGRFANKLQVLKDGRSVYSPLFSGVFWEAEETLLEDIERIEIIRGPNAVAWGSNAVNGTINIITRKARDTQGGLLAVATGTEDRGNVTARYGTTLGDSGHLRVYGKGISRRPGYVPDGGRAEDDSAFALGGFRADLLPASGNRLTFSGEAYRERSGDVYHFADPLLPPTYLKTFSSTMRLSGGHLQGRLDSLRDDGSEVTLQAYVTRTVLDGETVARQERTTVDVDAQYRFAPFGSHDLIVGANFRNSRDSITTPAKYVRFASQDKDFRLASLFFNDEITVVPERFRITLGARLENNNFSGTALQPTARFLWTPNSEQTVWGALSNATRTPSRSDLDAQLVTQVVPPSLLAPFPILVTYQGSNGNRLKSERMDAAELGYRQRFGANFSLDATGFVHRYRDVIAIATGPIDLSTLFTQGYAQQPIISTNGEKVRIYGFELAAFAQLTPAWRLQPSYTWQHGVATGMGDTSSEGVARRDAGNIPRHLLSLRSQHNITQSQQLDFWLKYKSRIAYFGIPDRADLDIRYAWAFSRSTELSIVGQNLLHRRSLEYISDYLPSAPVETGRGAYVRVEHRF